MFTRVWTSGAVDLAQTRGRRMWVRAVWESFAEEGVDLELSLEAQGGLWWVGSGRQALPARREDGDCWGLKPRPE